MAKWENRVFTTLTLPSRSLSYTKIVQGECNGKVGKQSFHNFDTAEPKLILYKDIVFVLIRQLHAHFL